MLRGADPSPSLASTRPQLPDTMRLLPPHMVWTGLDTAIAADYIKLLLIFGMLVIEGAPTSMEYPSLLRKSVGMPTPHIPIQSGNSSWLTPRMI